MKVHTPFKVLVFRYVNLHPYIKAGVASLPVAGYHPFAGPFGAAQAGIAAAAVWTMASDYERLMQSCYTYGAVSTPVRAATDAINMAVQNPKFLEGWTDVHGKHGG